MTATEITASKHLAWCKQRAVALLDDGDVSGALASFASDVRKHPETADNPAIDMLLVVEGMRLAVDDDAAGMRRLIEGFAG